MAAEDWQKARGTGDEQKIREAKEEEKVQEAKQEKVIFLHTSLCSHFFRKMQEQITKGCPLGDTLSLSCEASVGTSGSNN